VVAAVVVLREDQRVDGVRDSKKLSARRREVLAERIRAEALDWHVALADPQEIDRINILAATMLAMRRALEGLTIAPDRVRVDGNRSPDPEGHLGSVIETVVRGDASCPAIGAASILAKVHRDRLMLELHERFPQYGFDQHKGYPTAVHREALGRFGACPEHRRSFRPVRAVGSRAALAGGQGA